MGDPPEQSDESDPDPDPDPDTDSDRGPVFETAVREGVVRINRPETTWLSTGWDGGRTRADAVYSVSVPTDWSCDTLDEYVDRRLARAGFEADGPVLLTGVDAVHLRGARCGPVEAYATAGLTNPAALPTDPASDVRHPAPTGDGDPTAGGTVNLVVGTTRHLTPGALANLVAVAAEAKAATLLAWAGVPGTSTDAVVVGCDPTGRPTPFSGSCTAVGAGARACVREAIRASLDSRYPEGTIPDHATADHATTTAARAAVFVPGREAVDEE